MFFRDMQSHLPVLFSVSEFLSFVRGGLAMCNFFFIHRFCVLIIALKLYIDDELMPKAGVVVRAATFHSATGDFPLIPLFSFSRNREAKGLLGCLRVEDLNLKGLCAAGGMKFLHIVADGAPVNRASVRVLATFCRCLS